MSAEFHISDLARNEKNRELEKGFQIWMILSSWAMHSSKKTLKFRIWKRLKEIMHQYKRPIQFWSQILQKKEINNSISHWQNLPAAKRIPALVFLGSYRQKWPWTMVTNKQGYVLKDWVEGLSDEA